MATETIMSDHHSPDKTMEKKDEEERQTVKLEDVDDPLKESGGKDEEKKLDADGLAGSETHVNKVEETLPASVEVEKAEHAPVVDVHVEADSEKMENSAPSSESVSAPGPDDDETVETQSGELPTEVDLKVVESSVLDPESDSAPKPDEMPEEHSVDDPKVDDDVPIVDASGGTGSKVEENSVQDQESSSASEPGGEIVERQLQAPEGDTKEVQKVDDASVAEAGPKLEENSVLEPESSPSEPIVVDSSIEAGSSATSEPGGETVQRQLEAASEHLSTEIVETQQEEKVAAEAIEQPEEKPSAETGQRQLETDEHSSTEIVEAQQEEKAAAEAVEHPEEKPSAETVERQLEVTNEHSSTEIVETQQEEKVVVEAVEQPEEKPSAETVQKQLEATDEHSSTEIVETQQEEKVAAESVEHPEEKPSAETVQRQLEATDEHWSSKIVETQQEEKVAAETIEQPEEKPSAGTAEPSSSIEAVDRPVEHLEVIPAKESELEMEKVPEASSQSPGLVTKLEGEIGERDEVVKGVEEESEEFKPSESLKGEVMTSEGTKGEKREVNETLKEEETGVDQVLTNQEAQIDPKEEEGDSSTSSDVIEKAVVGTMDKEGTASDVVERLSKDETVVAAKVEEEKEEKNVKVEDSEGKSTKVEESIQTETAKNDDRNGSNFVAEAAEIDREQVSRDVEVVTEMKKMENVKEDIPLSVDDDKDNDGQVKLSEVDAKETAKNSVDNLDSAKEDGEIAKSDPSSVETLKNGDNTKSSVKPPKQDDSVKKHSNNLMSKVKQSIVKVKKAIIGKSPSSKALQPEAKKDEKVK